MLDLTLGIVPMLIVMIVIVGVHEGGHFVAARAFGLEIRRFSIGLGRTLWSFSSKNGVEVALRLLPIGGFIDVKPEGPRSLASISPPRRLVILAAGPIANVLLAISIYSGLHALDLTRYSPPIVNEIMPDSPAERAGLQPGDRIVAFDGFRVDNPAEVALLIKLMSPERPTSFRILRDGVELPIMIKREEGRYGLKWRFGGPSASFIEAVGHGAGDVSRAVALAARMPLILWSADASPMSQFQSPVAIAQKTGAVVQDDEPLANLFALAAAISLALALGNLLPLPVLDGGRMLLTLVEWTCARRPGPAFERRMSIASLAAILGFSAVIATNDVARLLGLALF